MANLEFGAPVALLLVRCGRIVLRDNNLVVLVV